MLDTPRKKKKKNGRKKIFVSSVHSCLVTVSSYLSLYIDVYQLKSFDNFVQQCNFLRLLLQGMQWWVSEGRTQMN